MRFVSNGRQYSLGIHTEVATFTASGDKVIQRPFYTADFGMGTPMPHEAELALEKLSFDGRPEGVEPWQRMGVYDTEVAQEMYHWTDEQREEVEQKLMTSPGLGVHYIPVEQPKVPAPFPRYDEFDDVDALFATLEIVGFDPEKVRAYEAQNRKRDEVLERLQALIDEKAPDNDLVVA